MLLPPVAASVLFLAGLCPAPTAWAAEVPGGSLADAPDEHGGVLEGTPNPPRPVARVFKVTPRKLVEGRRPRIRLRIEEPGTKSVRARVVVQNLRTRDVPARMDLGTVRVRSEARRLGKECRS